MNNRYNKVSTQNANILQTIAYKDLILWDVKRYLSASFKSIYPIVRLGDYIQEENHKVKLNNFPDIEFGILGVSNKTGVFDAYKEKGANIQQPYKKMEIGWLAYNPFRINVGSIGIRTKHQEHEFISPAYVVFNCSSRLLPEFLYRLLKTRIMNDSIKLSTTGGVRQSLSYDRLRQLQIILPPLSMQKKVLDVYNYKISQATNIENEIEKSDVLFHNSVLDVLNISIASTNKTRNDMIIVKNSDLQKWSFNYLTKKSSYNFNGMTHNILTIKQLITMFEGGKTPSTSSSDLWDGSIHWASPKDFNDFEICNTEDTISPKAVEQGLKVYPIGTIVAVVRSGILRHKFPIAITRIPTAINQDLKAIAVNSSLIDTLFFFMYLRVFNKLVLERAVKVGVTVESINTNEFLDIPIVVPPMSVQKRLSSQYVEHIQMIKEFNYQADQIRMDGILSFEKELLCYES